MEISRLAGLRDAEFPSLILHESDDLVFDLLAWRSVGDTSAFCPGCLTIAVENETVDTEILESLGRIGIDEPVGAPGAPGYPTVISSRPRDSGRSVVLAISSSSSNCFRVSSRSQMPNQPSP
jgi:hypothetical protein